MPCPEEVLVEKAFHYLSLVSEILVMQLNLRSGRHPQMVDILCLFERKKNGTFTRRRHSKKWHRIYFTHMPFNLRSKEVRHEFTSGKDREDRAESTGAVM